MLQVRCVYVWVDDVEEWAEGYAAEHKVAPARVSTVVKLGIYAGPRDEYNQRSGTLPPLKDFNCVNQKWKMMVVRWRESDLQERGYVRGSVLGG